MSSDKQRATTSTARWLGLVGGPIVALAVYILLRTLWGGAADASGPEARGLSESACRVAGVAVLMGIWWLSEAIPLAATALLPVAAFPLLSVMPVKNAAAPFGDDLIFLFLGGFLLQLAMERWGLHRRIALTIILGVGAQPARIVAGVMLATAVLSMWISNSAAAALMLPIGMSLCQLVAFRASSAGGTPPHTLTTTAPDAPIDVPGHPDPLVRNLGRCVMIGVAWSATIGGVATPIGTPPNVLLRGYLQSRSMDAPSFGQWMLLCGPMSIAFLCVAWFMLTRVFFPVQSRSRGTDVRSLGTPTRALIRDEIRALGPIKPGEWATMSVFALAVIGWLFGGLIASWLGIVRIVESGGVARAVPFITDSVVAVTAGVLLFVIPVDLRRQTFVLDWRAFRHLPYGVLLLFGGGLALAEGMGATGLDLAVGDALKGLDGLHPLLVVLIVAGVTVLLSEFMSNTALAATLIPIMASVTLAMNLEPARLLVPLALAASCAFMMPAGTPPSAIAFSSGYFTIRDMARTGAIMDLFGVLLISITVYTGLGVVMGW
ncbi:MAG: SLC13 family permease [Phycisphaerales bacterium]